MQSCTDQFSHHGDAVLQQCHVQQKIILLSADLHELSQMQRQLQLTDSAAGHGVRVLQTIADHGLRIWIQHKAATSALVAKDEAQECSIDMTTWSYLYQQNGIL